jgi:hypothetical protein
VNSAFVFETCGLSDYTVVIEVSVGDVGSIQVVRSSALSGLYRLDLLFVGGLIVPVALCGAELAVAVVVLSGSLQVITLLPGIAFILIVAFLAASIALNIRLVRSPFVRLRSFGSSVRGSFLVGTWFALGGIELYPL